MGRDLHLGLGAAHDMEIHEAGHILGGDCVLQLLLDLTQLRAVARGLAAQLGNQLPDAGLEALVFVEMHQANALLHPVAPSACRPNGLTA